MHIHLSSLLVLAATLLPLSPARPILDASELSGLEINPVTISQSFTNVRHLVKRGKEEDLARHEAYKAARAARVIEAEKRSKNKYRAEVVEARKVAALDKKIAGEQAQLASAASASARAQLPVVAAPSAAPPPELTPEEVAAAIDADNKVRKNALARLDRKKEALFELRDRINNHTKTIQALHARHIEIVSQHRAIKAQWEKRQPIIIKEDARLSQLRRDNQVIVDAHAAILEEHQHLLRNHLTPVMESLRPDAAAADVLGFKVFFKLNSAKDAFEFVLSMDDAAKNRSVACDQFQAALAGNATFLSYRERMLDLSLQMYRLERKAEVVRTLESTVRSAASVLVRASMEDMKTIRGLEKEADEGEALLMEVQTKRGERIELLKSRALALNVPFVE